MENFNSKKANGNEPERIYYDSIKNNPLLTSEEEQELALRIQRGDKSAREKLIESNLRLVFKIAKNYNPHDISIMDIIQEGNIGLIRAAEKFDYNKNTRFSTYASTWIRQAITRAFTTKKRAIRLPNRKEEKLRIVKNATQELIQKNHKKPHLFEIAKATGFSMKEINSILQADHIVVSLDQGINEDQSNLQEIIEDYTYDPDHEFIEKNLKEDTLKLIGKLKEKEKQVLLYRYSLVDGKKYTLRDIADRMGISPESVRQIELRGIKKLKVFAAEKELRKYCYN